MLKSQPFFRKFNALVDNYRLLIELSLTVRMASRIYRKSYLSLFRKGLVFVRGHKYRPWEAFDIGLFDPAVLVSDLNSFSSKQAFSRLQATVNPLAWYSITEDKGIFYRYCMQAGIRIPQLYAIFYRTTSSWTLVNSCPQTVSDWQDFLEQHIQSDFVMKPTNAAYGAGLQIYRFFENGRWSRLTDGRLLTAGEIAQDLLHHNSYPGYVLQERIKNHRVFWDISNAKGLQTIRIVTHVTKSGECHFIYGAIKLIVGEGASDNFDKGKSGNLILRLDTENGAAQEALVGRQDKPGVGPISRHPVTGSNLSSIAIPHWDEVRDLVEAAAYKFLPIRSIGWDIAVTESGPVVIEANMRFDPPNQFRNLRNLRRKIETT